MPATMQVGSSTRVGDDDPRLTVGVRPVDLPTREPRLVHQPEQVARSVPVLPPCVTLQVAPVLVGVPGPSVMLPGNSDPILVGQSLTFQYFAITTGGALYSSRGHELTFTQ